MGKATVVFPNGETYTRRTRAAYTYAVIGYSERHGWYVVSMHTSLRLARRRRGTSLLRILPVDWEA